jgi:outer membrane protein assembly factor BamD (BamD/ComL family)
MRGSMTGNVAARTLLETLINARPDSDYVAGAKLSIADAWYSEGKFKEAEMEYVHFVTFFPNRPEVPKAQLRAETILIFYSTVVIR